MWGSGSYGRDKTDVYVRVCKELRVKMKTDFNGHTLADLIDYLLVLRERSE